MPIPPETANDEAQGRDAAREARYLEKVRVYDRRLFRANLFVSLGVFLVSLVVYSFNLVPDAIPGPSSDILASAFGLGGGLVTRQLVWRRALGAVIAASSPQGAVWSANAFCMAVSALGVALVYLVLAQLLLLCFDYEHFELEMKRNPTRRLGFAAVAGGLAAAAALLFCAPYWGVAAQVRPDAFHLCWLLLSALCLLRFGATGALPWLFAFGALHALGLSQASCFWGWAPVFYLYALFVLWSSDKLRWRTAAAFALMTLLLFVWLLRHDIATVRASAECAKMTVPDASRLAKDALKVLVTGVWGSVPRAYWLILLGLVVAPFLASLVVARRALNGERDVAMLVLHAIVAIVTVLVILDPPFSPWQLYGGEELQILPHAMMAMAFGYLVAWADTALLLRDPGGGAVPRGALAAFSSALLLFAAFHNAADANPRSQRFVWRYADAVLDGLRDRTFLATGGMGLFDSTFRIRAYERGQVLHTIDLAHENNPRVLREVAGAAPTIRLGNVARVGFLPMLKEWIGRRAEAGAEIALMTHPDLWHLGPWESQPSGLVFLGVPVGTASPDAASVGPAEFLGLVDALEKDLEPVTEESFGWRRRLAYFVRQQVAFAGNNLAFLLERAGRDEEAFLLYRRLHSFHPEHIPALLNWATLVRDGMHPEDRDAVQAAFEELQQDIKAQRHPEIGNLALFSGYVSDPIAYAVAGWNWARSGEPRLAVVSLRNAAERLGPDQQNAILTVLAEMHLAGGDAAASEKAWLEVLDDDPGDNRALVGLVNVCLLDGRLDQARDWLEKAKIAGVPEARRLQLEAALDLASGDPDAARAAAASLRTLLPNAPEVPMLLSQVEVAAFDAAKTDAERDAALSRLRAEVDALSKLLGAEALPVLLAAGESKRLEARYADARQDYLAALAQMKPEDRAIPLALGWVLDLDFRLADKDAARLHAREMLSRSPDHAFANYILGSLALEAEQYESAEDYLEHAAESAPGTFFILNDLAVAQQALRKLAKAEETARAALDAAPDEYSPHDTLGYILLEKGETAAALAEFEAAQKIFGTDPRVDLHIAMASFRLGDIDRARRLFNGLRDEVDSFVGPDERDWRALERGLSDAR